MKEIIGGGFEKRVYVDEHNADKVVKVYLEKEGGENKARARFYLGKILHMLFPENFPNIHLSASGKIPFDKHTQKVVMEKKELDQWHKNTSLVAPHP